MIREFIKNKDCGCIVKAIICSIKNTPDGEMYLLGGHNHLIMCDNCKKIEENDQDTLRNMWLNDNITNNFEYAGWKQYDGK